MDKGSGQCALPRCRVVFATYELRRVMTKLCAAKGRTAEITNAAVDSSAAGFSQRSDHARERLSFDAHQGADDVLTGRQCADRNDAPRYVASRAGGFDRKGGRRERWPVQRRG